MILVVQKNLSTYLSGSSLLHWSLSILIYHASQIEKYFAHSMSAPSITNLELLWWLIHISLVFLVLIFNPIYSNFTFMSFSFISIYWNLFTIWNHRSSAKSSSLSCFINFHISVRCNTQHSPMSSKEGELPEASLPHSRSKTAMYVLTLWSTSQMYPSYIAWIRRLTFCGMLVFICCWFVGCWFKCCCS